MPLFTNTSLTLCTVLCSYFTISCMIVYFLIQPLLVPSWLSVSSLSLVILFSFPSIPQRYPTRAADCVHPPGGLPSCRTDGETPLSWHAWRDILHNGKVLRGTLLPQLCKAGLGLPIVFCQVPWLFAENASVSPSCHAGSSCGHAGVTLKISTVQQWEQSPCPRKQALLSQRE